MPSRKRKMPPLFRGGSLFGILVFIALLSMPDADADDTPNPTFRFYSNPTTQFVNSGKTGTAFPYIECGTIRSTGSFTSRECTRAMNSKTKIGCAIESNNKTGYINFISQPTNFEGWVIKAYKQDTTTLTNEEFVKPLHDGSSVLSGFYLTATYDKGTSVKKLDVKCNLWNDPYLSVDTQIDFSFIPPVSAGFKATASSTNKTHRTRDTGEHIIDLDFADTVPYLTRKIKASVNTTDTNCSIASVTGKLEYLTTSKSITLGSYLDIKSDNPSSAKLKLSVKKETAGTYKCTVTITQEVT